MEAFRESGIVTDYIDEIPLSEAEVVYPSGTFRPGETRTPTQVKDEPKVSWAAENESFYTLAMIEPDAPAPVGQVLHWLVINIPGCDVSKGDHRVAYIGSGPPQGTGIHRYIFLVFKQGRKLEVTEPPCAANTTAEGRTGFNMQQWLNKYQFGTAVAGNFYRAEYDDLVPTHYKQLGLNYDDYVPTHYKQLGLEV